MKSILLKFENEKEFFKLAESKMKYETVLGESMTWEQFIYRLKINWDRLQGLEK